MINEKKIAKIYEYYIREILKKPGFIYKPSTKSIATIFSFQKLLKQEFQEGTLGSDWLFRYFSFQFNYWHERNNANVKDGPMLSWIIGSKAFGKWKSRPEKHYWYFVQKHLLKDFSGINENSISRILNKDITNIKVSYVEVDSFEEKEKERFYNTPQGLANCILRTTLFNSKSWFCKDCIYNFSCRDTLKIMYLSVYLEREKVGGLDIVKNSR